MGWFHVKGATSNDSAKMLGSEQEMVTVHHGYLISFSFWSLGHHHRSVSHTLGCDAVREAPCVSGIILGVEMVLVSNSGPHS